MKIKTCTVCAAREEMPNKRSKCKACQAEYLRAYKAANESRINQYQSEYKKANKEELAAKQKAHYEANKVRILQSQKRYYQSNRTYALAKQAEYVKKNPEKVAASRRAWLDRRADHVASTLADYRERNPEIVRLAKLAAKQARRARELNATTKWNSELDALVIYEANRLAKLREKLLGGKWHVDHIVPMMAKDACGLHNAFNLQVTPAKWNQRKCNGSHDLFLGGSQ